MVGTLHFFVIFIISLIAAHKRAGLTSIKLTGEPFNV